ncbi:unnamed protein product [Kuraishia capsulata CBS 1993]|uniref:Tubulin-specific chaperone A n=1 Tax=Kuraishia capsulata CBS 1993 TaxID=1382522 RepID=W6MMX5_9ASCO|nr:uncharacterized protein KUCA_T00003921001 [Kuraishia capsulata CBS 1993]CDK27941.1 unnamed protein product [Kuraishia capsulata CBS 1993]
MAPSTAQIKANALTRLVKEKKLYYQELEEHKQELERLQKQPDSEYEVKVQQRIVDETQRLIPTLDTKIETTLNGLKEYLADNKDTLGEEDTALIQNAIENVK